MNASRAYVYAVARACDAGKVSRRVRVPHIAVLENCSLNSGYNRTVRELSSTRPIGRWKSLSKRCSALEAMVTSTVRLRLAGGNARGRLTADLQNIPPDGFFVTHDCTQSVPALKRYGACSSDVNSIKSCSAIDRGSRRKSHAPHARSAPYRADVYLTA